MSDHMDPGQPASPDGKRLCAAHSKQSGKPCQRTPAPGATVCRFHGAEAPQVKAAAARRLQEAEALAVVARYGVPQHIDWHVAMQESLDETYGNVLALRDLVARLSPGALVWGIASEVEVGATQFPGVDVTRAAGIAPTVDLYGRERDRLFRMAHDCGKLGLEVRRQQIDEAAGRAIGEQVLGVLVACLRRWGLDDDAHRVVVFEELSALRPAAVSS